MPPAPGSPAASATNGHYFKTARHCVIPTRRQSRSCRRSGHGGPAAGRGGPAPAWHGPCLWYGGAPPPVESPTASFGRRGGVLRPVGRASQKTSEEATPLQRQWRNRVFPGVEIVKFPIHPIRFLVSSVSGDPALKALPALCHVGLDPVGPWEIVGSVKQPTSSTRRIAVRRSEKSLARKDQGGRQSIRLWQGTMTAGVEARLSLPASYGASAPVVVDTTHFPIASRLAALPGQDPLSLHLEKTRGFRRIRALSSGRPKSRGFGQRLRGLAYSL